MTDVLAAEPSLRAFETPGSIVAKEGHSSNIDLDGFSLWLLAQARLHGSDAAARKLEEFVEGQHRDVLEILAVAGVSVDRKWV